MASTLPGESPAHSADEAQALRDEIEQTREHLGDTVEQLAAKADVKKQARAEAARLGEWVRVAVARARGQAMLTAAKARDARDKGARTAREQRGPLAAAVGAMAAALAALIIWKREAIMKLLHKVKRRQGFSGSLSRAFSTTSLSAGWIQYWPLAMSSSR